MINSPKLNSFHEIEFEINMLLNTRGLSDIIEVTYGYFSPENNSDIHYNTSLFGDFLGISYFDFINRGSSFPALKLAFIQKTDSIVQRIENLIGILQECTDVDDVKKELIVDALNYNIVLIRIAQNGIDFELEKAGMKLNLSEEEIKNKLEVNEGLEKIIFGGNILDSEEESVGCLRFIEKRFQIDGDKLTPEEKEKFLGYIEELKSIVHGKGYNYVSQVDNGIGEEKDDFFHKFGKVKISRDVYMHIFQEVLTLSGLKQEVVLSKDKGSIYDGPDYLEIPDNDKFTELTIERVLRLIAHEVLGHYYNQRNHEKFFGNLRGAGNVEKEEGLAKFMEYTLLGRKVTEDDMYEAPFSQLFVSEVLPGDKFADFLSIFTKISESKSTNDALFMRRKRNYSMSFPGAQHKDTTYTRGLKKISDYVQNGGDIRLLFNGKFGLDDIISKKIDYTSREDFLLPIFIPDVIIFYVLIKKGLLNSEFTHDNFVKFLEEKYKELLPGIDFRSVEMVSFFQKRKLMMILDRFDGLLGEKVSEE